MRDERFVTPKVYFLGCTMVEEAGVNAYLEDSGNEADQRHSAHCAERAVQ